MGAGGIHSVSVLRLQVNVPLPQSSEHLAGCAGDAAAPLASEESTRWTETFGPGS